MTRAHEVFLLSLAMVACSSDDERSDAIGDSVAVAALTADSADGATGTPAVAAVQEKVTRPVKAADPADPPPAAPDRGSHGDGPTSDALPTGDAEAGVEERDPGDFAANAFPPTVSDTEWHRDAWQKNDCLRCHETGVGDAPRVRHASMPDILLTAKCRTCHVQIPGAPPRPKSDAEGPFATNAFPPMVPASESHKNAWLKDDCLLCHERGVMGAPVLRHESLPPILKTAKCRSCHVQVRAVEATARDPASGSGR